MKLDLTAVQHPFPQAEETEEESHIGQYQFSSKLRVVQDFIKKMGYERTLGHLEVGSELFDKRWKELAILESFGKDQHDYIELTHYQPQMKYLKDNGIDLTNRSRAVKDMVWSTSVQFGPKTALIKRALGDDYNVLITDEEIIELVQDYKIKNNEKLFKSSSDNVRKGTLARAKAELISLKSLLAKVKDE